MAGSCRRTCAERGALPAPADAEVRLRTSKSTTRLQAYACAPGILESLFTTFMSGIPSAGRRRYGGNMSVYGLAGAHLLAEEAADLREVDLGALGAGARHQRHAVLAEGLHLTRRQARLRHRTIAWYL